MRSDFVKYVLPAFFCLVIHNSPGYVAVAYNSTVANAPSDAHAGSTFQDQHESAMSANGVNASISCGQTVTGVIQGSVQQDVYSFAGFAGEVVSIWATGTWTTAFKTSLYDSSGNLIGSSLFGKPFRRKLLSTGLYTIVVKDVSGYSSNTYYLSLQFISGRCAKSIACGQTISSSVVTPVQQDVLSFSGSAGEVVRIAMSPADVWLRPFLFDQDGSLIAADYSGTFEATLPSTGTYTILLGVWGDWSLPQDPGPYAINLQFLTGRCAQSAITCGHTITGTIATGMQANTHVFDGKAGERVSIAVSNVSLLFAPIAQLYDPTGIMLCSTNPLLNHFSSLSVPYTCSARLPTNGTYTVAVWDTTPYLTGEYTLTRYCPFSIGNVRMVSSNELGVDLVGSVPPNEAGPYRIRFSAQINGQQVNTRDYDITDQLRPGDANKPIPYDAGADQRKINLKDLGVPRFQDHQKFDLKATFVTSRTASPATEQVEIPLPVIIIHGVTKDWFQELLDWMPYGLLKLHLIFNGWSEFDLPYRTLYYFDFSSQNHDAAFVRNKLYAMVQKALSNTYAKKVDLFGHSLGGLIARDYVTQFGSNTVRKVITLGTPLRGSAMFYILAFNENQEKAIDLLYTSAGEPNLRRWLSPTYESLYVGVGGNEFQKLPPEKQYLFPNLFYNLQLPEEITCYRLYNKKNDTPHELLVEAANDRGWYHNPKVFCAMPGDGTVTVDSALDGGENQTHPANIRDKMFLTWVGHAFLPSDPVIINEIYSCLTEIESTSEAAYRVTDLGAVDFETGGYPDSAMVGFARLEPNTQTTSPAGMVPGRNGSSIVPQATVSNPALMTAPAGMAIFTYRKDDTVVSQATVPAAPLIQSGRIYAEITASTNTGIAIANPSSAAAIINYFFTGEDGQRKWNGTTRIEAGKQIAQFLDQKPFEASSPLYGTFTFESSTPVAVVALRGLNNERSEFLMTTLPVCELKEPGREMVIFPHFADGGGWSTQVVLVNPGNEPMSGTISFFDQGTASTPGNPVDVAIGNQTASTFSYSIAPRSARQFCTAGKAASLQVGSAYIRPATGSGTPSSLGIFSFRNAGVTVAEASVEAMPAARAFRLFAEYSGPGNSGDTGISLANPSSIPVTASFVLCDLEGNPTGHTGTLNIPGNGQVALFLNQISGFESLEAPFKGVLRISTSSSSGIVPVGLRCRTNERGDYLITTTVTVDESGRPVNAEIFFPQVADGGGYTTEFVLFSGSAGQATLGTLRFFSRDGKPLTLSIR